ncbi:GRAM domain-containing protein 2B-like isoform X2 [Anthonomus grandis grandis]|uniref:GRAM domain-containing protein 2B-like isoform X2 n=1 Tax=Anthonomus grandis grandis TaxID=2921223 RepID=UPI002165B6D1|nr:GRAM domain-containing protein 2B-like isoform X2 [Anthonomus grandis grandis]
MKLVKVEKCRQYSSLLLMANLENSGSLNAMAHYCDEELTNIVRKRHSVASGHGMDTSERERKCVKINLDGSDQSVNGQDFNEKGNFLRVFKRRLSLPAQRGLFRNSFRVQRSHSIVDEDRGSSGNFGGSGGPRSAPVTPQGGQLGGAPPGGLPDSLVIPAPTIQRSPSHSHFSKTDKSNLKHLSTSAPTMTAQGHLTEPPSPKAIKDPKVHTTSKARQKKFLRHFPNVEEEEKVLNHYSCALIGDILLQGHLYITKNYFAFYSNVFGYVTKLLIPILTVEEITKEKTARIIPNAVGITTSEDKHIFGSLMSRDSTLAYMKTVWEKAKREEVLPDPEIVEVDQDSSESGESGRESPTPDAKPSTDVLASAKFDRIRKESVRNQTEERKGSKGFVRTLKDAITEFRKLPRQGLILVATTFLLILLFLSAAVLLYRINKIQNKYSISLQGNSFPSTSEDIYSDLLQWQTHLHSKSADAVNNFLDNNLDQIAKVRQSLEALTALLMGQNSQEGTQKAAEPSEQKSSEPARIIRSES